MLPLGCIYLIKNTVLLWNIITIPVPTLLIIHVSFTKLGYYNDFWRITWHCNDCWKWAVITGINNILKYIKIEDKKIVTIFQNAVFTVFLIPIKSHVSIFQNIFFVSYFLFSIFQHIFWLVVYVHMYVFFNISIWVYMYMFFICIHVCISCITVSL